MNDKRYFGIILPKQQALQATLLAGYERDGKLLPPASSLVSRSITTQTKRQVTKGIWRRYHWQLRDQGGS